MDGVAILVLTCHYFLVGALCVYGGHRIYHSMIALRARRASGATPHETGPDATGRDATADGAAPQSWPKVTVQAPVFNERFVVERLIDALAALDYPRDRLQIQIVDDSTDDGVDIAARRIAHHRARGVDMVHVRRASRDGYKAGALNEALAASDGEFIAVFDADFMPEPDFLKRTIGHFDDPQVGMVQTRWHHLNIDSNLLTRVQAVFLDAHFAIEQLARARLGAYFNFNGTAGVWRKRTIEDAGGWRADTLTEDLDLSYRAQLKNWRFKYLRDVGCPSELPADIAAFKTQQHRWAKGAVEVMKKLLVTVWKSPAPLRTKIEATFHLTGNFTYMLMLIDTLFFLIPSVHIRETAGFNWLVWLDIPLFFLASLSHAWFFLCSQKLLYGRLSGKLAMLPALLAVSIGLGVNNGRAVIEALAGHVTGFVRTPKTGALDRAAAQSGRKTKTAGGGYKTLSVKWAYRLEIMLGIAYFSYILWALVRGYYLIVPFLALFALGFAAVGLSSRKAHRAHAVAA